jgi:hypothetical protein
LQHEFSKRKRAIDLQFRGRIAGAGVQARAGGAGVGEEGVFAALQRRNDISGNVDNENIGSAFLSIKLTAENVRQVCQRLAVRFKSLTLGVFHVWVST